MSNLFIMPKEDFDILTENMGWYCGQCYLPTTLVTLKVAMRRIRKVSLVKKLPKCPSCGRIDWTYGIRPVIARQGD